METVFFFFFFLSLPSFRPCRGNPSFCLLSVPYLAPENHTQGQPSLGQNVSSKGSKTKVNSTNQSRFCRLNRADRLQCEATQKKETKACSQHRLMKYCWEKKSYRGWSKTSTWPALDVQMTPGMSLWPQLWDHHNGVTTLHHKRCTLRLPHTLAPFSSRNYHLNWKPEDNRVSEDSG